MSGVEIQGVTWEEIEAQQSRDVRERVLGVLDELKETDAGRRFLQEHGISEDDVLEDLSADTRFSCDKVGGLANDLGTDSARYSVTSPNAQRISEIEAKVRFLISQFETMHSINFSIEERRNRGKPLWRKGKCLRPYTFGQLSALRGRMDKKSLSPDYRFIYNMFRLAGNFEQRKRVVEDAIALEIPLGEDFFRLWVEEFDVCEDGESQYWMEKFCEFVGKGELLEFIYRCFDECDKGATGREALFVRFVVGTNLKDGVVRLLLGRWHGKANSVDEQELIKKYRICVDRGYFKGRINTGMREKIARVLKREEF